MLKGSRQTTERIVGFSLVLLDAATTASDWLKLLDSLKATHSNIYALITNKALLIVVAIVGIALVLKSIKEVSPTPRKATNNNG